jgi:hypothetical protein
MDTIGRTAEKLESRDNLLSALLHDPHKTVADDLAVVAPPRDLRGWPRPGPAGQLPETAAPTARWLALGDATADFRAAMANLRAR